MTHIDMKLLHMLEVIYNVRSITQAAAVLGLSQPTISINLAKLRTHYGDPLFVRSPTGVEPTPFACELVQQARLALAAVDSASNYRQYFDPKTIRRLFHVATTDISQITFLPLLVELLGRIAPGVTLRLSNISGETRTLLETGTVDLAVGFMPQLEGGFFQQKMFTQRYVCIPSNTHPRVAGPLSTQDFLREGHVRVTSGGTGHSIIERLLADRDIRRRVTLEVPNYLGLLDIIARTALLAVVPHGLTSAAGFTIGTRAFELPEPFSLPTYQVKQHWHERNHKDPANRWLRSVIAGLSLDFWDTEAGEEMMSLADDVSAAAIP